MSNHITIIDKEVGTNNYGFCVRVGQGAPGNRLAHCLGFNKYANGQLVQFDLSTYKTFKEAYEAALEYRNREHPDWAIRADCTLAC